MNDEGSLCGDAGQIDPMVMVSVNDTAEVPRKCPLCDGMGWRENLVGCYVCECRRKR
jgi:hypothetical protein